MLNPIVSLELHRVSDPSIVVAYVKTHSPWERLQIISHSIQYFPSWKNVQRIEMITKLAEYEYYLVLFPEIGTISGTTLYIHQIMRYLLDSGCCLKLDRDR